MVAQVKVVFFTDKDLGFIQKKLEDIMIMLHLFPILQALSIGHMLCPGKKGTRMTRIGWINTDFL